METLILRRNLMNSRSRNSSTKGLPLQTFTYYIPAPPYRKSGYREREFDKIMAGISGSGFAIIDIQVQSVSTQESSGVFIIATIQPLTKKAKLLDQGQDIQENFKLAHSHSTPDLILEEDDE